MLSSNRQSFQQLFQSNSTFADQGQYMDNRPPQIRRHPSDYQSSFNISIDEPTKFLQRLNQAYDKYTDCYTENDRLRFELQAVKADNERLKKLQKAFQKGNYRTEPDRDYSREGNQKFQSTYEHLFRTKCKEFDEAKRNQKWFKDRFQELKQELRAEKERSKQLSQLNLKYMQLCANYEEKLTQLMSISVRSRGY